MRRHWIFTFVAAVTLLASSTAARAQETIDFEDLNEGDIVTQVFGDAGGGPVAVDGFNPRFGAGTDAAMIFDSDCDGGCTGDDSDLGAPNADFAGPGVGAGGESGQPFQNDRALGNTLIVSEDLDGTDPDDEGRRDGVSIDFDFSALGTVTLFDMDVLDIEPRTEEGAVANLYGPGDALITSIAIPTTGDNGLVNVDLGPTAGVTRLEVVLNGSGAVDNITFLADEDGECGNDVVDPGEECDGTDDGQCPGECRADCTCPVCGDGIVDEGEECDDGNNEDGDGCSATCEIEERGGEGCTPGYWKQPHHFDSWVEVAPTDNFNDVFGTNATFSTKFCASADPTLLEALECKGGSLGSLARHAVAALLNALSGGVDYELSDADVIELVQEAIASGEHEDAKDLLKDENEEGCPLN